jgi:mannose-1-phosphate guanylyltransferase / mannose-6-phosphate isomerase
MSLLLPVIMCGGAGTRMWPESRESLPKQFIPLLGERSTFQTTAAMFADRSAFARLLVISNHDYRFQIAEQLAEIGVEADIVLEPMRRDSGAAVAAAVEIAARRDPATVMLVMAADHNVEDRAGMAALFKRAADIAARGYIVTLGVPPTFPATGYGYIKPGAALEHGGFAVESFVEKPTEEIARRYVAAGYLWNSGNFVFQAGVMRSEIAQFEPDVAAAAAGAVDGAIDDLGFMALDAKAFSSAPKKSIDYAVMERTQRAAVVPADVGWSDVGTWTAVRDLSGADENGNSIRGRGVVMHGSRVFVRSEEHLTAVVGLDDVVVVTTQDAVLVLGADHADKVKELVEQLRSDNRPEALAHKRIYRPWGYYQSIDQGERYQVKRIVVKPQGQLSLQRHHHRAEHWVVVRGTAEVNIENKITLMHENESIYLPIGAVHRLSNPGKIDLELIEVQTGSYLGEDDIVRLEDVYNRA